VTCKESEKNLPARGGKAIESPRSVSCDKGCVGSWPITDKTTKPPESYEKRVPGGL